MSNMMESVIQSKTVLKRGSNFILTCNFDIKGSILSCILYLSRKYNLRLLNAFSYDTTQVMFPGMYENMSVLL